MGDQHAKNPSPPFLAAALFLLKSMQHVVLPPRRLSLPSQPPAEHPCLFSRSFSMSWNQMKPRPAATPSRSWKPHEDSYQLHSLHRCTELVLALQADQQSTNPLDLLQNQIRFQQLLHTIWSAASTQPSVDSAKAIEQTLSYIHANFAAPLSSGRSGEQGRTDTALLHRGFQKEHRQMPD
ncbi:hypothetical protein RI662_09935 [Brevibacillus agri]|uniref:hypothetical protein n=1 Tax=Brevibacillus agri TaxID=51101 RepID=UPI00287088A1|nr:hypothetical protein [Brevibacillus agri]MDR9504622.1 hypothetical protein [Brevibacillus agri]